MNNLNVSSRLRLGFFIICAVLLAAVTTSWIAGRSAAGYLEQSKNLQQQVATLDRLTLGVSNIQSGERGYLLSGQEKYLERYYEGNRLYDEAWAEFLGYTHPGISTARVGLKQHRDEILIASTALMAIRRNTDTTSDQMQRSFLDRSDKASADAFYAKAAQLREALVGELAMVASKANSTSSLAQYLLAVFGVGGVIISYGVAHTITKSVVVPLNSALEALDHLAEGRLYVPFVSKGTDEVSALITGLERMRKELVLVITDIQATANTVTSAAVQIEQGNFDLSARTEQQASSLQEIAATVEELSATVKANSDNSQAVNTLSREAAASASAGQEGAKQLSEVMSEVHSASEQVQGIISTIDSIAFQTNILSLNAAVEAARAGEAGRGFAVVASEVRVLAQRCAEAAKDVKGLVQTAAIKTTEAQDKALFSGRSAQQILEKADQVRALAQEVANATEQQSAGLQGVNQAVSELDQVTQQNSALVEEASAAMSSLRDNAQRLSVALARFKLEAVELTT